MPRRATFSRAENDKRLRSPVQRSDWCGLQKAYAMNGGRLETDGEGPSSRTSDGFSGLFITSNLLENTTTDFRVGSSICSN